MRHGQKNRKFHRTRGQRVSFVRNLANNLIRMGKIETTEIRAKAIRPVVERLVTIARKGDLASRRLLISRLGQVSLAHKLIEEIGPKYKNRPGGYLRIQKLGTARKRDGAMKATIEFV